MSSHLRQSPDSPVIHTGFFLCRNLSQQNGSSGELLIPRFLLSKGAIFKGLMPFLQAALGCSGEEAALPLPQAPSTFSPQRSVTISDSSAFCRFHGIIPDATPASPSPMVLLWLLSAASRKGGKEAKYWAYYK